MPDKKLTDNEIIKALECCSDEMGCKKGCPCFDPKSKSSHCAAVGDNGLEKLALDLINRLQEKDETRHKVFETKCEELEIVKAENERLKVKCENTQIGYNFLKADFEESKADKIIAERKEKDARDLFKSTVGQLKQAKAEAYKECIEKVKEHSNKAELVCSGALVRTEYTITKEKLDNLLNELVGENNVD